MAYTLHSKFGRFNHKVFKRKNINLEEIHSDKTYLTSGIIHLHNNYLSFLTYLLILSKILIEPGIPNIFQFPIKYFITLPYLNTLYIDFLN